MDFKNKVALVTGSSKGIGAATILEFAKKNCNVIINYNESKDEALKLQKKLNKYNIRSLVIKADISKEEEVKNMIDKIIEEFNHIDILVNNAGIAIDTLLEDKTVLNFKKILDVNLIGAFITSKYVGEIMLKQKYGKIINISSTNGIDTFYPMSLDYDASKAGLMSLTHNFAKAYAPYINVNAIASGWVNTSATEDLSEEFKKTELDKIFLKRFAEPEEIAKVITFLASDDASYITGSIIRVDGGY